LELQQATGHGDDQLDGSRASVPLPGPELPTPHPERHLECPEERRIVKPFCIGVLEQQASIYDRREIVHQDVGILPR